MHAVSSAAYLCCFRRLLFNVQVLHRLGAEQHDVQTQHAPSAPASQRSGKARACSPTCSSEAPTPVLMELRRCLLLFKTHAAASVGSAVCAQTWHAARAVVPHARCAAGGLVLWTWGPTRNVSALTLIR